MSSAPRLFLSALTREFGPARQRVANILIRPGYAPVWEGIFGVEPGNLRPILRANRDDCRGSSNRSVKTTAPSRRPLDAQPCRLCEQQKVLSRTTHGRRPRFLERSP